MMKGPDMRRMERNALFLLALLGFTACAAYTPPPLTTAHPAHPEAASAPEPQPSTTLAYSPADMPTPQPAMAMAQHTATGASASETGKQGVVGEGKVIAVVPGSQQIVVDHKAIKGFMDAMTMGYRVDPPSILDGVQAGDDIRFTIDTQKNAIVKIEPNHMHMKMTMNTKMKGFVGEGKVIAVVPNTQQVVIEHGDIKGYMDAMTMGFRVASPKLLDGLEAGDSVRFTIGEQEKAIIQIEKMNP